MTAERDQKTREVYFECDGCGETHASGTTEFSDAAADLRAEGWWIKNEGGSYTHRCPTCVETG